MFWVALVIVVGVPLGAAARSPLLEWRDPIYIAAGFSGVLALALLLFQPLLAGGYLPGISVRQGRRVHRWLGVALMLTLLVHIAGLWMTSPPDMIDALLFVSPTPFSIWGVVAMWALLGTAVLAMFRRRLRLQPGTWRLIHKGFAVVIVIGSTLHAMLIEGTMELVSKSVLSSLVVLAMVAALFGTRLKR